MRDRDGEVSQEISIKKRIYQATKFAIKNHSELANDGDVGDKGDDSNGVPNWDVDGNSGDGRHKGGVKSELINLPMVGLVVIKVVLKVSLSTCRWWGWSSQFLPA